LFSDHIPIVVYLLRVMEEEDLVRFRAGILWAIGRLGDLAASEVEAVLPSIAACLDDSDPQVRGMAVWCLAQSRRTELLQTRSDLLSDEGTVALYLDGHLLRRSVAELARQAWV
jgi:HEAT repeat protein